MTTVNLSGTVEVVLPPASDTQLGGVMVQSGSGLAVDGDGNLSVTSSIPVVTIISISLPYQDVVLDNTSSIFIIDNPTTQVSGSSPPTYHHAFIDNLSLPYPVTDGHTFSITCTSGALDLGFRAACDVDTTTLTSGGSHIVNTTEGLITLNQSFDVSGNYPDFVIPGTYRWVDSLSSWVQIA